MTGRLVPFHQRGGQGRTWVGFVNCVPLSVGFLTALVVELLPCGLGPQNWGGGESQSLRPGHADDGALVWGRTRIGMLLSKLAAPGPSPFYRAFVGWLPV